MSFPRLLIVAFALSSLNIAFAEDQPQQPENSSPIFIKPYAGPIISKAKPLTRYNFWSSSLSGRRVAIPNPDVDTTCYTMRTYVADPNYDKQIVIKTGPDEIAYNPPVRDDSPLTGSYTTCQPSSQFSVKMTVQPVVDGNNRK